MVSGKEAILPLPLVDGQSYGPGEDTGAKEDRRGRREDHRERAKVHITFGEKATNDGHDARCSWVHGEADNDRKRDNEKEAVHKIHTATKVAKGSEKQRKAEKSIRGKRREANGLERTVWESDSEMASRRGDGQKGKGRGKEWPSGSEDSFPRPVHQCQHSSWCH